MTELNQDSIAVRVGADMYHEAYHLGRNEYSLDIAVELVQDALAELPADASEAERDDHVAEAFHQAFDGFTQSAEYANDTLPTLRALAGYADGGYGTYQIDRLVAVLHDPDDDEAELVEAGVLLDSVFDEYDRGLENTRERALRFVSDHPGGETSE